MNIESFITCSLQTIHLMDATLEEDESDYFLKDYIDKNILHYVYRYPSMDLESVSRLVNKFSFFCGKIRDIKTNKTYPSNIPLGVFRYVLLEDLSWSHYYTVKRKPGYVVEGAFWSNGIFYQVRQDSKQDFEIYEITLMIDNLTQKMHAFPQEDCRFE